MFCVSPFILFFFVAWWWEYGHRIITDIWPCYALYEIFYLCQNTGRICLLRHRFQNPTFVYLCKCRLLASPVLWSEALPGADDLFGSHFSPRGSPVLVLLILRLYGIDAALRRNIHFNLEKTAHGCRKDLVRRMSDIHSQLKYCQKAIGWWHFSVVSSNPATTTGF